MGRAPCCSKVGLRRGPWTVKEDNLLVGYIRSHGEGHWRSLPKKAGLLRCGKSCRLRWMNYLRPDIKRGNITPDEEDLIIRLHSLLGNRWSLIAGRLPGRTDNEIKNHWNSHLSKRVDNAGSSIIDKRRSFSNNDKHPNESKKRKNGGAKKAEETSATTAKVNVHQPKATRLSHSLLPLVRPHMSHSSNVQTGMISTLATCEGLMTDMTLEGYVAGDNIDGNGMDPLIIRSGFSNEILSSSSPWRNDIDQILSPGATSSNREMLEKIFEEYQELLTADDHVQLESFADSLLI